MLKLGMALLVLVTVIVAAAMDLRAVRSQDSAAFTELDYRVVGGTLAAEGAWPPGGVGIDCLPKRWSSARFTASTLTRGSPKTPRSRPSTRL